MNMESSFIQEARSIRTERTMKKEDEKGRSNKKEAKLRGGAVIENMHMGLWEPQSLKAKAVKS